jgi:hypothetical protein
MALSKVVNNSIESVDAAKLTGTLPAISGANLTNMAAGGAWNLITTTTASTSSSISFTGLSSTYATYAIVWQLTHSSDSRQLFFRTSTDGGSSYDSGGSDYDYHCSQMDANNGNYQGTATNASNKLLLTSNIGNTSGEGGAGIMYIHNPSSSATYTRIQSHSVSHNSSGYSENCICTGSRLATTDVDAVQLFPDFHTVDGSVKLYGIS